MTATTSNLTTPASGTWRLDSTRSSVEFRVRGTWGLLRVTGSFDRFRGSIQLHSKPRAELIVDAASLRTGIARRNTHLRSADFFDVANHPELRFVSHDLELGNGLLDLRGELHAAGHRIPIEVSARLRDTNCELEIDAETNVDQRQLGMTTGPFGMTRAPATLILRGVLTPDP